MLTCVNKILTWITHTMNHQINWYYYHYYWYYYYHQFGFLLNQSPITQYMKSESAPTIVLFSNEIFVKLCRNSRGMYCHNFLLFCFVQITFCLIVLCYFFHMYHILFLCFCFCFCFVLTSNRLRF